jgi:hypothetical protein
MTEDVPGETMLPAAFRRSGLTLREAWIRYLALGGNADEVSVAAQLEEVLDLSAGDYNVLAHALNEALDEISDHGPRVPQLPVGSAEIRPGPVADRRRAGSAGCPGGRPTADGCGCALGCAGACCSPSAPAAPDVHIGPPPGR